MPSICHRGSGKSQRVVSGARKHQRLSPTPNWVLTAVLSYWYTAHRDAAPGGAPRAWEKKCRRFDAGCCCATDPRARTHFRMISTAPSEEVFAGDFSISCPSPVSSRRPPPAGSDNRLPRPLARPIVGEYTCRLETEKGLLNRLMRAACQPSTIFVRSEIVNKGSLD